MTLITFIVAVLTVGWLLFGTGFYAYLTVCGDRATFVEGRWQGR